jgi:sulfatase modifying factor 1
MRDISPPQDRNAPSPFALKKLDGSTEPNLGGEGEEEVPRGGRGPGSSRTLRFRTGTRERAMNLGRDLSYLLVAVAFGCGGRSGLDALYTEPASGTSGGGPSSGSGSSGAVAGSSSGSSGGGGSGAQPPSCRPGGAGMTNCGASSESCCTSPVVSGGTYYRTYTNFGAGPAGEADAATVSPFRLDKYEVTVGRFRQFVSAWNGGAGYMPPGGSGKHTHLNGGSGLSATGGGYEHGWVASDDSSIAPTTANLGACGGNGASTWTSAGSQENLPINCVNWYEAYAFCIWDGGFLPSEAEWEYAAVGGSQQRQYPWGSTDPGADNQYAIYDCDYPTGRSSQGCSDVTHIAPVGTATLGAGRWGQLDLSGSMLGWILDWFGKCGGPGSPCTYAHYINPCTDCAFLTASFGRVSRGSGYNNSLDWPWVRRGGPPSARGGVIGFRCARTP